MRITYGLLVFLTLFPFTASAEIYEAGKHYRVLPHHVDTTSQSKIEVAVFFSYICIHCANLLPRERAWAQAQQSDVVVRRVPVVWNPSLKLFAEAYYVADEKGIESDLNDLLVKYLFSLSMPGPESWGFSRYTQGFRKLGPYFPELDRMQSDAVYCHRATQEVGNSDEVDSWLARKICVPNNQNWQLMKIARKYRDKNLGKEELTELFLLLGVGDFDERGSFETEHARRALIQPKIKVDVEIMKRAGVTGTPAILVNDKYLVKPDDKVGVDRNNIFDVIDYLVDVERKAMKQ